MHPHLGPRPPAPLPRVYEGCARVLAGNVEGTTLVKLARDKGQVSYLVYPDFDDDPHPALDSSVVVSLANLRLSDRSYAGAANPPILHRKELFVAPGHPLRERFAALSRQEERAGLYGDATTIGTRDGWADALAASGMRLRGHRLVRAGAARS